jgi:hypothetical protein
MSCCLTSQVLTHYTTESKTYYCDLGEAIKGRTVSSVTGITSDDAALTISSVAVISSDVSDYDQFGNAITIEAGTGVSWTMSGGTAGSEDDDFTATLRITFATSAGTEVAVVRVLVLAALP